MIESWGCGIERIIDACRVANIPAPLFPYDQAGLWIEFTFRTTSPVSDTQETTQEKNLNLLKVQPEMTQKRLSSELGLSNDGIK